MNGDDYIKNSHQLETCRDFILIWDHTILILNRAYFCFSFTMVTGNLVYINALFLQGPQTQMASREKLQFLWPKQYLLHVYICMLYTTTSLNKYTLNWDQIKLNHAKLVNLLNDSKQYKHFIQHITTYFLQPHPVLCMMPQNCSIMCNMNVNDRIPLGWPLKLVC